MKSFFSMLAILLMSPLLALAHGEDKPGPNGGFIRMPGAFHTEVIPMSSNSFKVFLLDIAWKNPSVKDSSVKALYRSSANQKSDAVCKAETNFFVCKFPANIDISKSGKLEVQAEREAKKGIVVSYQLPLKLEVIDDGHGAHH
jgi:hypothetical protein